MANVICLDAYTNIAFQTHVKAKGTVVDKRGGEPIFSHPKIIIFSTSPPSF
jgi:hypothetical protein